MSDISHLKPETAQLLLLSDGERIEKIRSDRWIGYPVAQRILRKLEDLLVYPRKSRMPSMLIVGESNNGKTSLVTRFCNKHPAEDNPEGEGIIAPVLYIQSPPVPDEARLYNTLLDSVFATYKANDRVDRKQFQVVKILRYVGLKVLVIDEIHSILAGPINKQRAFLNVLKYLSNELQISIVAAGTKDAFRAMQTEPQIANRFEPAELPRWTLDENFLRLLVSFEHMLPLQLPSKLHSKSLSARLFTMCEGNIGELSRVLSDASVEAIVSKQEYITPKILDSIGWVTPSQRKRRLDTGAR
ncbi:AAA family ATPase [Alteromonadaceae bacterium M269]|nr:AAA family ATPase [Alteromonadaceae bacterium M269]